MVMRAVLSLIEPEVVDLERIVVSLETEGVLRRFPDGSIYVATWDAFIRFFAVFEGRGEIVGQLGSVHTYLSEELLGPASKIWRVIRLWHKRWTTDAERIQFAITCPHHRF
jgi:hypothetical protein